MSPDGSKSPPEERLLRLIRGNAPQLAPAAPAAASVAPTAPSGPWGKPTPVTVVVDLSSWWMRAVQAAFGVVIVGELVTLAVVLLRPVPTISIAAAPTVPSGQPSEELTAPVPSVAASVSRPLFATPISPEAPGQAVRPGGGMPSADAKALAARLSLIGIMGGAPAQAIIEDAQTKKTFVVTAGQSLIEGLVVSEVLENRVVLDLNGETIELSL